ncbi:TetR/AcrR family transcriptional regulator [Rhodococcus sp. T2V]|uniref:TetR/AcrR family transcriptional regulator n=1 Tax=Rhodococcus sp. T2V TaxID=3034164 RepID=UPI0023E1283B|nr:TetR/AcrR family transcriptional regulator [Rhodococcus sp. T2V]MDF3310574.1 TetR/AcrR family transcriptional regulator [Rhodococcus sp. T2V]
MDSLPSSLSEEKRQVTKTRLANAAERVFAEKGYLGTRVDDIAAAAGVSRATFYLHFPSKLELVVNMLSEGKIDALQNFARLNEILAQSDDQDLRVDLREWLAEWQQVWREKHGLYEAMITASQTDPAIEDWFINTSGDLIDVLDNFFDRLPESERAAARTRAIMLETSTRSLLSLTTRGKIDATQEEVLTYLCDIWAAVFLAS